MSIVSEYLSLGSAELWVLVGIALLILEILSPVGFYLSFSVAGFLVAIKIFASGGTSFVSNVENVLLFAAIGVGLILPIRALLRNRVDKTPDINDY